MTIVFTGGGTGGHFYPIIAVAEALRDLIRERHLVDPKLYYLAPTSFDEQALFENGIQFVPIPAGKLRRYASFLNITDTVRTLYGVIKAVVALFRLYPDVVFSKGGYASVPTTIAARILGIPVIIHESDAHPGRANLLASHWAQKIAIAFESAAPFFPKSARSRIARTGIPIRKSLLRVESEGARQYLSLDPSVPTVLVVGGSQGAQKINELILAMLGELVQYANVIHQTGASNLEAVTSVSKVVLRQNEYASRYHPYAFLDELSLQRAAGAATVIVSRAGANTIAEIGFWKKPAILIPIPESISHDQRSNAYGYATTGAAVVLEEANLTPHILLSEIRRISGDATVQERMSKAAEGFSDPDSARVLANELVSIGVAHEQ